MSNSNNKTSEKNFLSLVLFSLKCKCPECQEGALFEGGFFSQKIKDRCEKCGLDFSRTDSADGPAVFLIFVLGFLLVPLALTVEMKIGWPIWLHVLVWGSIGLILTLGSLKPIKALMIALQYKYRKSDWDKNPPPRV